MSKTVYQLLTALSRCAAGLWPVDRIIKDLTLSTKADPLKNQNFEIHFLCDSAYEKKHSEGFKSSVQDSRSVYHETATLRSLSPPASGKDLLPSFMIVRLQNSEIKQEQKNQAACAFGTTQPKIKISNRPMYI